MGPILNNILRDSLDYYHLEQVCEALSPSYVNITVSHMVLRGSHQNLSVWTEIKFGTPASDARSEH